MPRKTAKPNPEYEIRGQKVKKIRKWLEISIDEVMNLLNMNAKATYNNYEFGWSNFTDEHLQKLSELFKVPLSYLKDNNINVTLEDMIKKDKDITLDNNKNTEGLIFFLKNIKDLDDETISAVSRISQLLTSSALEKKDLLKSLDMNKKDKKLKSVRF